MSQQTPPPLMSLRTAVILALALLAGVLIGALSFFAGHNTAAALLAGVIAIGGAALGLNKLVD